MAERALGRIPSPPDPRDENFPARRLMTAVKPLRQYRQWYNDVLHVDQGAIGQCTAASLAHIKHDGPITHRPYWVAKPAFDTVQLYCRAQRLDGLSATYCSHRNDTGATMRAAAEAAREHGFIANYWWFRTLDDALAYLTNDGPLWVGTWWRAGMSNPVDGFARYSGTVQGGHAYVINGISWRGEWVRLKNSWGLKWGDRGHAKVSFADLARLFADQGEFLAITEQRVQ